ncbi:MAG: TonB-dependent receptor [Albidovulum sp.]
MDSSIKRFLSATLLGLSASSPAVSARDANPFESIVGNVEAVADHVSIATGRSQPAQTAPAVTTVVTAQQIRDSGARDLIDVLAFVPGFFVGRTAHSVEPVISVRGFTSSFNQTVLVLLDGIPQTERVFGDRLAMLGIVPLDIIERVEIMRGPGSALYGADAYSAVVNVVTRRIPPEKTQVVVGGGSRRTRDARLFGGGRAGAFDVVGAVEYRETDGDETFVAADAQTNLDALFGTNASLAPGRASTHRGRFGAHLNATDEDTALMLRAALGRDIGTNVGLAGALDPFGHIDTTTVEGLFEKTAKGSNWSAKGSVDGAFLRYEMNDVHYLPPGALGFFPDGVIADTKFDESRVRLQGRLDYTGLARHRLTVGAGAESGEVRLKSERRNYSIVGGAVVPIGPLQDTGDALGFGASSYSRDLLFVYGQDEWDFHPDWTLTWGVRHDRYSDFGDILSPRLALVWNASPYLTAKLIYGRGFRGPSLLDTEARHVPAIAGNPDLKPEKLDSLELAFDYRPSERLTARLNVFYQRTEDQIRLQNDGGPTSRPENVGRQKGRGLELEAWWDIARDTQLYGAYAYQDNTDETTGEDAGYTPHHQVLARLLRRSRPWSFSLQARHVGNRDRIAEDARPKADTYTLVDALVRRDIMPGLEAGLEIRNLFDADAEEAGFGTAFPGDLPLPGRTFFFDLTARF